MAFPDMIADQRHTAKADTRPDRHLRGRTTGAGPRLSLGDQRRRRAAGVFARLFHRARQHAVDRRVRPVRHRFGGRRHAVAHPRLRFHLGALPHRHHPPQSDRHLHRRLPVAWRCCPCRCWPRPRRRLPALLRRHRAAGGLCRNRLCRSAVVAAGRSGAHRQQRPGQIRPRRRAVDRDHGVPRARRGAVHAVGRSTASGSGRGSISAPTPPRCCWPSASIYPRQRLRLRTELYLGGLPIRSMSPAPKCCSTCRWNSTSCWCWRSAARIWPASMPSSCGWST